MKKLIITSIFTCGFIGLLVTSCCKNIDAYWMPESATIIVSEKVPAGFNSYATNVITQADTVTNDTLSFNIEFEQIFLAQESSIFSQMQLINSAYAMQPCPRPGHDGLKFPISNIVLTSNNEFSGVSSGESLNEFAIVNNNLATDPNNKTLELSTFSSNHYIERQSVAFGRDYFANNLSFKLVKSDTVSAAQKFNINIAFQNGTTISVETPDFYWE